MDTLTEIKRQINSMVYLNIVSYSVLSGCGTCSQPTHDEAEDLDDIRHDSLCSHVPYNVFFTESLYKKCMPQYEQDIDDPYNFSSFRWVAKKRKQEIDLDVMANSIIACCNLIERVLTFDIEVENPSLMVYILYKTALHQARFIKKHLMVGNMFYHGEDASKNDDDEHCIQISSEDPGRVSQFAVIHAFAAIARLSNYNLNLLTSPTADIVEDISILQGLMNSLLDSLGQTSTKELSLIGLHMVETYKAADLYSEDIMKALRKIAKELQQRITETGNLLRNKTSEETASPYTVSNCLNFLSQVAYMFSSKSNYDCSHKLYNQFKQKWDEDGRIFKIKDANKQNYNIKNVASILSALCNFSKLVHDQEQYQSIHKQISEFSDTTFIQSGLFNGQSSPILQENKIELPETVDYEKPWAPIFNKGFEYKISKKKYYCEADVFRADYVIPACAILLNSINN